MLGRKHIVEGKHIKGGICPCIIMVMKCLISLRDLAADSSLVSLPLDLVVDSKVSRRLEEDNNKMDRHLHRHHPTRHKNHPLYTLLTLELSEAAFTDLPIFGWIMAAVSGFIQHMLEEIQLPDIVGGTSAGYIMERI
jgi:hypothetical protein